MPMPAMERLVFRGPVAMLTSAVAAMIAALLMTFSALYWAQLIGGVHVLFPTPFWTIVAGAAVAAGSLVMVGAKAQWLAVGMMFVWIIIASVGSGIAGVGIASIKILKVVATGQYGEITEPDADAIAKIEWFQTLHIVVPLLILAAVFVTLAARAVCGSSRTSSPAAATPPLSA